MFGALYCMTGTAVYASVSDSLPPKAAPLIIQDSTHPAGLTLIPDSVPKAPAIPMRRRSTQNDTWYYGSEPDKRYIIDSGISQMHRYDVVRRDGPEYFNLGNTGTEAYPLIFSGTPSVGFNMGFRQFDAYRYSHDSIRYYEVIRPYAEIFYSLSLAKDQVFQGRFANVHKKTGILYGVDFRRINSNGTYLNQKAIDNGFSLYGIYNSKNRQWNVETDLIYNSFIVQENGGLTEDIFYKDTTLLTKTLAPVNMSNAILNYSEVDWFLKTTYNVGPKYDERINDTTVRRVTLPIFKVSYQFDIEHDRYSYFDLNTDSAYYSSYLSTGDTLRYTSSLLKVGQRFGLDFNAKKLTSDTTIRELNFLMGAAADLDYYDLSEYAQKSKFTNLYITGYLKSNPALNPRLIYKAAVAYYLAGYNQNDLQADGALGADLRPFGKLTANAGYQLKQSDWIYHSFKADSSTGVTILNPNGTTSVIRVDNLDYSYYNNFPKMSTVKLGGEYTLDKYGIKVSAYNYVINNYFYFSAPATPAYIPSAINMLVLSFSNRFAFKGFHLDDDLWFQKSAGSDVIRLPLIALKSSIYYERHVFHKALWLAFGFDVRYYTPFTGNGYNPLTGQFYEQNYLTLNFYPVLDVFLNVKIKTVRIFLNGTNLSSFFSHQNGYYTAYIYPAADATFKFGAAWRFFE